MVKKNTIKVFIELPDSEKGLADIDDLSWMMHLGHKVKDQVNEVITRHLVDKYAGRFDDVLFDKEEIKREVKKRLIDKLAENAIASINRESIA